MGTGTAEKLVPVEGHSIAVLLVGRAAFRPPTSPAVPGSEVVVARYCKDLLAKWLASGQGASVDNVAHLVYAHLQRLSDDCPSGDGFSAIVAGYSDGRDHPEVWRFSLAARLAPAPEYDGDPCPPRTNDHEPWESLEFSESGCESDGRRSSELSECICRKLRDDLGYQYRSKRSSM